MATILFAAAGAALGSGLGGSVLGLSGAVLGRAAGATLGKIVDQRVLGAGAEAVETGRMDRFYVMGASEGTAIARCWGRMRLPGQVIWTSPFVENRGRSGGKGMPTPKVVQFSYTVSLALALCEGVILGVGRIWADGTEIAPARLNLRVYTGDEDQLPDPLIEVHEGHDSAPAYRGIAYVVIENLDLSAFGNRVPQFSFEVLRRAQGTAADGIVDQQDAIRAVSLIPGTGEFALATSPVWREGPTGLRESVNIHAPSGVPDMTSSLQQLRRELPNCGAVSLVVSWFGDDLRCAQCRIRPRIESEAQPEASMPWRAGGLSRAAAREVPRREGMSIYGGTPADLSVIEAIRALQAAGQAVMFYPFVLMEQMDGNALPDPYTGGPSQPALPWRGRITLSLAPGRAGSPDTTAEAAAQVAAFFGAAQASDFSVSGSEILYSGPADWGYRRFILHYAHLCKLAGGVESFCIGSELRGLTQIRGPGHSFPAVTALIDLAREVRAVLGAAVKIGYAADWSEYFGYHAGGSVYFHLDPLWSDPEIDFIGIDNYMPLSDWRDGAQHRDGAAQSIYSLEYLQANIAGGEGFDWHYQTPEAADAQIRTPIADSAYGEDWIFRVKDLRSWWGHLHHNRIDGVRQDVPTGWVPMSKPVRFTEYGCPAIDKGTNEPNKFMDLRSSESAVPRASRGQRDDLIQAQYFRAHHLYWSRPENNPVSPLYGAPMLDQARCYAWAWDARPYPEFPRQTTVWADGPNHDVGHWLNGRVSAAPLDRVLHEICDQHGVTEIDAAQAYGLVHGYGVQGLQSGRASLQSLSLANGFEVAEAEGVLRFQSRLVFDPVDIGAEDLALLPDETGSLRLTRLGPAERAGHLRLSYVSGEGDFAAAVAEAQDQGSASPENSDTELPLVLPAGTAKAIVHRWLAEGQIAQDQVTLALPPSLSGLTAGRLIRLDQVCYRIDQSELAEVCTVTAVRMDPGLYHTPYLAPERPEWPAHSEAGPVQRLWLDLPLLGEDRASAAPFLAVAAAAPGSPVAVWHAAEDAGYTVNTVFDQHALIGKTLTELHPCPPGVLDRGAPLVVQMPPSVLESISRNRLLAGENLMAIGDGQPEGWEVFQFERADLLGPDQYGLSLRLRGRFGTERGGQSWPAGSWVVLLDAAVRPIALAPDHLGVARHYRIGLARDGYASDKTIHEVLAFRGLRDRPLAPVHGRALRLPDGTDQFDWVRRTRAGGDVWEGMDVPLAEEREAYALSIRRMDQTLVREVTLTAPQFDYSADQRRLDAISGPYQIEVAQMSARFGRGLPLRLASPD